MGSALLALPPMYPSPLDIMPRSPVCGLQASLFLLHSSPLDKIIDRHCVINVTIMLDNISDDSALSIAVGGYSGLAVHIAGGRCEMTVVMSSI